MQGKFTKDKNIYRKSFLIVFGILLAIALIGSLITARNLPKGLSQIAKKHNLKIGTAVSSWQLDDPQFASVLIRNFNLITPENEMKFELLSPAPGEYDFSGADKIIAFAKKHGISVRGHTLVWTNQLPKWLVNGNFSRDELIIILHNHIDTVVSHYRGQVSYWDVVNESLAPDGSISQDNFWMQHIGPEYIELAFRWAHEADPNALLFYNEANAEGKGLKADGLFMLANMLITQGIPLHGIGFEMHTGLGWSPKPDELAINIQRLADLGLEIHITEMDVRIIEPASLEDLYEQAKIYAEIVQTCLDATNCTAYSTWGLTDTLSWIPHIYPGTGSPLLFYGDYTPKPAYYAIQKVLEIK